MVKRAVLKQTRVMIAFQIESEAESELIQAINTIVTACLFLWQLYKLAKKAFTWPLDILAGTADAVFFGYQVAGIRARSLAWGVLGI